MQQLTTNTLLQGGRYKIEKVLGQGGFGITYLAIQSGLERKVAIKEFFMKELCGRDESTSHVTLGTEGSRETVTRFREKFLKEARNIAKLNHPNIVRIIDVFEENGTAYYVMEYAENGSLADKVKREGYLTEPVATRYIKQVAEALDYIHQQKMNHLDVKPANIMLNEKDEAVLIDFGLSKQYDATTGNQTSTTPVGISHGYAPIEQYKEGGVQDFSPETDIYALGATFFKLLTGITPPSATDIMEDGLPIQELKAKVVSSDAIAAISKAMEPRKRDRIKNASLFIEGLKGDANRTSESKSSEAENEETMLVSSKQERDNETTLLNLKQQNVENERKRKVSEVDALKEKAEDECNEASIDTHIKKVGPTNEAKDLGKKQEIYMYSGFAFILFLTLHMTTNVISLFSAETYNAILRFQSNWYVVLVKLVLVGLTIVHFFYAFILSIQNSKTNGKNHYAVANNQSKVKWHSQNLVVLGIIILLGLGIHFVNFWANVMLPELLAQVDVEVAPEALALASNGAYWVQVTFTNLIYVVLYLAWFVTIWFYLTHVFGSAIQTMDWKGKTMICSNKAIMTFYITFLMFSFAVITIAGALGVITPELVPME